MKTTAPILFDRQRLRKRRARAAANFAQYDFLYRTVAEEMAESFAFISRPFPVIAEIGAASPHLRTQLATRTGTTQYITVNDTPAAQVIADEELLPFADQSVDAVVSLLSLHWVNDLPGTLAQIHRILKPDGMFMAVLPGGDTLRELRQIFAEVEAQQTGGITPRIAPLIDVRDGGALLQRAGFSLPVVDSDRIEVTYPHLFGLMDDLRGTAQVNMLRDQVQHFTPRQFFAAAAARYSERFADAEGRIPATVELITMTGWKPAANQQQPAKRGSGQIGLGQVLQ